MTWRRIGARRGAASSSEDDADAGRAQPDGEGPGVDLADADPALPDELVLEVATGRQLQDEVRWAKFTSASWDGNGEGFFYTRYPEPVKGSEYQGTLQGPKVYYHRRGTPQSEDRFVFDAPVVAAIHGTCMGGGLELSLGCHYRVAAPGASIALPEVKIGLVPGAGGTQRLPRAVGKAKAMDMVLTSRMMDAAEAERAGLVSRVVPADRLMDEALAAAAAICGLSLPSLMMAKEAVNRAFEAPLADGVRFERRLFHSLFGTADQREGMTAFLEKRKPAFSHR